MERLMYYFSRMSSADREKVLAYAKKLLKSQEDGTDPDEMEYDENLCEENLQDVGCSAAEG